ncbi:UV radiation resistance-associated protein-like [Saccostrea cucullata]|uniref:UV radiation resistance-associated protein-like n=1 Tax=Saccostrea cuccullata TaxID=36930 RepID=UPI002ED2D680
MVDFINTSNLFELPSNQRRLRHLKLVAVRNLKCQFQFGKELRELETFFSLHKDRDSKEFYQSETITASLNPSWQSFDISRYEDKINTTSQSLLVRVWVKHKSSKRLLLDWMVDLNALEYFADKLQQDKGVKYAPNTVIFGMFDHFFCAPDIKTVDVSAGTDQNKPGEETAAKPLSVTNQCFLKVEIASVKKSYTTSSLSRIYTVLRAIKQTQASVHKVRRSIEDKLLSSQETTRKKAQCEDLILKREQLCSEVTWRTASVNKMKDQADQCHSSNQEQDTAMKKNWEKLREKWKEHGEKKKDYDQTREKLIKENAQLFIRRKQLIRELAAYIYPITEKKGQYFIADVCLPNSEDFQGKDDNMIAVSLGYTCHLLLMISSVLDIPLRYGMDHQVSRSTIHDHIHTKLEDKERVFPLYSKGKEQTLFKYGVFTLNKNISQMRFYLGLGTPDLRTTLQNIKTMLENRLGLKPESQTALLRPMGERQNSEFDKTDTQSSLASYGRMVDLRRDFSVPMAEETLRQSPPTFSSSKKSEEDIFNPSSDDNFFKISNPVSERLAVFDSEINGGAQDGVNFHSSWDSRRRTCINGVETSNCNGSEQDDEHIYESISVSGNSERLEKSETQSNSHIS